MVAASDEGDDQHLQDLQEDIEDSEDTENFHPAPSNQTRQYWAASSSGRPPNFPLQ